MKLKDAALLFRIPDNTKVKKVGPPRLNAIGEPFGVPRVLNSEDRIKKLNEYRKVADAHSRERKADLAAAKLRSAAKKARLAQQKLETAEKHGPILEWLKIKGFCPQNETKINKGHMQVAFDALKEQITKAVRDGGDSIRKSTSMHVMIDLFAKYKVTQM